MAAEEDKRRDRLSILVIEDSPGDADLLRELLGATSTHRFDLIHETTLLAGIERARGTSVDAVLLDLNLPDSQGLETIERMTAALPHTPVIALTGEHDEELAEDALRAGAHDYIVKGGEQDYLVSRSVRYAVDRHQLRRELEAEKRLQLELSELKRATAAQQRLSGWHAAGDAGGEPPAAPLMERVPRLFAALQREYESLLDRYLEAIGFDQAPPRSAIRALAARLAEHGAGARDVIALHLSAVKHKSASVATNRARAYTIDGRLLALELMGHLVESYRPGRHALTSAQPG